MNILGINSFFEHPSVALVCDGNLVFAMEDERLTRIKHGRVYTPYKTYVPYETIYQALRSNGLTTRDIDEVAFSYDKWLHFRSMWGCFTGRRQSSFKEEANAFLMASNVQNMLKSGFEVRNRWKDVIDPEDFRKIPFTGWNHHLSHAASAFYCSGFEQALVVVADGSGEKACTSFYVGKDGGLKEVAEINLPHSLGFFYSAVTNYLGFEPFSDEYKVMGMAAYGEGKYLNEMRELLETSSGTYTVKKDIAARLEKTFGPVRKNGEPFKQNHFDLAKSAQLRLEEVLVELVSHYLAKTGQDKLCLAGGTFQNILANSRLARLDGVKDVFVQPAAHDAGTAVGAAALSWGRTQKSGFQLDYDSMFLGSSYTKEQVEAALRQANLTYEKIDEKNLVQKLADLLADDKIVALYRGRIEFGPRALGNRSLIASPTSKRTREKLNELKVREQFRPLAPLVAEEAFEQYFEGVKNRYMMFAVNVKEKARSLMPAIVHADGTARTQVVSREHDPFLHELLTAFQARKGIPVLINTSLNVRGKPIDESPYDALASFYTSGIDYIVLENYLVKHPGCA